MASHAYTTSQIRPPVTVVTSRRIAVTSALLALSGAAASDASAGGVSKLGESPQTNPDAALLAICAEAMRADSEMAAAWRAVKALGSDDPSAAAMREKCDEWFVAFCDELRRAQVIPARTPDGIRAKALLAITNEDTRDQDGSFTLSFLRELAGRA